MELIEITDQAAWDGFVDGHPYGHPLQMWAWGEVKRESNWTARRLALIEKEQVIAGAQMLFWPIPKLGGKVAYVPRGPVAPPSSKAAMVLLGELVKYAKNHGAWILKIEPSWLTADMPLGWKVSGQPTLLAETYTIDLTQSETVLLEAMRPKTRQYIRKSETEGVVVKRDETGDLSSFWRIYQDTAERAGFGLHALEYYQKLAAEFGDRSYFYMAEVGGKSEAFVWLVGGGGVAFELYGGMTAVGALAKANYALKSASIAAMKDAGYRMYDFNGRLHEGVSQFKAGFGPLETNYVGSYDWPVSALGYQTWTRLFPALKPLGRKLLKPKVHE